MNSLIIKPLVGGRAIELLTTKDSQYPNLSRLCADFGFRVFEVLHSDQEIPSRSVVVVSQDYRHIETGAITPNFPTLAELENYVADKMVDILHDYLFGFVEDDIQLGKRA